nr:putative reverse transcriptase domain-containing protein [Tanacetum cinerariifolium]
MLANETLAIPLDEIQLDEKLHFIEEPVKIMDWEVKHLKQSRIPNVKVQDYALWDVIENGNSFKPVAQTTTNDAGTSTTHIPGLVTTEEKAQKKNDVKARKDEAPANMALMAFLDSAETESKNASKDIPNELKESPYAPLVKDKVSDNKDGSVKSHVVVEKKTVVPNVTKVKFVRPKQ